MKVEVREGPRAFHYRLELDADDRSEARRAFSDAVAPIRLVQHTWRVELPEAFRELHPDLHAAAIWHVVRPLVGTQLSLPFAVSEPFAADMAARHGVRFSNVSSALQLRAAPEPSRPCLLFSGGMDSAAASLVFPARTEHLFLDRIPPPGPLPDGEALIDLVRQRDACAAVGDLGRAVHRVADDHESLFRPYPTWHSDMAPLSALYLADSLGLGVIDTGEVLDACGFRGYHLESLTAWTFQPLGGTFGVGGPLPHHGPIGLRRAQSVSGLSEVATSIIVARSPLRGRSYSCYYRSEESFCMKCDKCFKKLLLRHIADGEEVPAPLFERFLAVPRLAAIFERPYFDWHHVWYYLFQHLRCSHPFAEELHRQAIEGPDLSFLEKWYPGSTSAMVEAYRDEIVENILRVVPAMSAAETKALEEVNVPPLHAPARAVAVAVAVPGDTAEEAEALLAWLRPLLTRAPTSSWPGATLDDVYAEPGSRCIHVVLRPAARAEPDDRLLVMVERADDDDAPCYARAASLRVRYHRTTPLDRPWRKAAIDAVVRRLALAAEALRRKRLGTQAP